MTNHAMTNIALVIFDCDGVLVDSETIASDVFAQHLRAIGLPYTAADCLQQFTGLSLASCRQRIEQAHEMTLPPHFFDGLQHDTFARFQHALQPIAGVETALDWLDAQRVPYCVASSGSLEKMQFTLGHTGLLPRFQQHLFNTQQHLFNTQQRLFSAQQVSRGKPAPDLFLHAARSLQHHPTQCLVVEDSRPGIEAGLAAGMHVCAFRHPQPVPDTVPLADMAELPALIAQRLLLHPRSAAH